MPAALHDVQARVGQPRGEHATVAERDAGVVFTGHDERRLRTRCSHGRLDQPAVAESWPASMSAAIDLGGVPPGPGHVAHSTSRRARSGARYASSWASPPPNE